MPNLKICYVDMCNGVANQAGRCFRRLVDGLKARAVAANPGLEFSFTHVQPRNLGELPKRDADLVLSSGGPGSPFDGYEDPWCTGYRDFLDFVVEKNTKDAAHAPKVLAVCHSFELATIHFKVAQMVLRPAGRKFGVMPAYPTPDGLKSLLFAPFGDRLFVWEHRHWEAIDLDQKRLDELGGKLLARESRPERTDKGTALLAFDFAPGIVGTQFHPEADRQGLMVWVYSEEQATEFKKVYGEALYQRMIKTLDDPTRVARTFALFVPGWLTDRFNGWAKVQGLATLPPPNQDLTEFFAPQAAATG
jgi:GMP synthase-like glutamine amidotransferase